MGLLPFSKDRGRWVLTSCPNTGDEVVGSGWDKQFSTSAGKAKWWKCPSCDGWHLITVDDVPEKGRCPLKQN
jgi:hypothetical protein